MTSIFISYNSKDRAKVIQITEALDRLGKYQLWFDRQAILSGRYFAAEITSAVNNIDVLLLMLSRNSIGDKTQNIIGSKHVERELALADQKGRLIIPINLDNCALANTSHPSFEYILAKSQFLDAEYCQNQHDFDELVKHLEQAIEQGDFAFHHDQTLDDIDSLLKQGHFQQANSRLENKVFPAHFFDRVSLMKCLLKLSKQPLKNFSLLDINNIVSAIKAVKDPELQPFVLYLLGVLSEFYYQKNAIADSTPGLNSLMKQAAVSGRLKAKYLLMTEHILPADNGFAGKWKLNT